MLDDFISDIKKKDKDLFQLKLERYGISKMYQHVCVFNIHGSSINDNTLVGDTEEGTVTS